MDTKKKLQVTAKKDAYYFSHDSNARNDEKILNLRVEHGWNGYGLYWAIVECLRDANAYRLQCNFKTIAYTLHCEIKTIQSIISDFDLFIIDNDYFYSESLNKRMEIRESKSQKARESANKRWIKNANAMRTQCEGNAIKGKERKEKESKVNTIRASAIERILKSFPKVVLFNDALVSVGNAIQREVDKGSSEENAIKVIEEATKDYAVQLDDVKYSKQACDWYNGGGYLSVVSKPKRSQMREF